MNAVFIIVSAGDSTRWKSSDNKNKKEFSILKNGSSVLKNALYSVYSPLSGNITKICIVYKDGLLQETKNAIDFDRMCFDIKNKISFIIGGATRAESTKNAIDSVKKDSEYTHIITHDGARPYTSEKLVLNLSSLIDKYDAVIPTIPLVDTIKKVDNGFVSSTPERNSYRAVQTPQFFKAKVLIDAYECFYNKNDYDDSQTVERSGIKVFTTNGDINNTKITYKEDLNENINRI